MRMARGELVGDGVGDAGEVEPATLATHLRVEHHLEQQVAELGLERLRLAARDGLRHFVGFLDGVRRDAREILLAIPGAAALRDRAGGA